MVAFKKKETIAQNMAFMGIMAAINIIISVISAFSIVASVFLALFLPLSSTLVAIYCKNKYFPIYAFATFGLSIVATLWNMETTFFFVLPSIITGFIFGIIVKKQINPIWGILVASLIQALLTFMTIPLVNAIFQINIIQSFKNAFGLGSSQNVNIIIPSFFFVIALIQIVLSYIIVSHEITKFSLVFKVDNVNFLLVGIFTAVSSASIIGIYFLSLAASYLLLIISMYFSIFIVCILVNKRFYKSLIVVLGIIICNIFVFALACESMKPNSSLLLIAFTPFGISLVSLLISLLSKKEKED